MSTLLISHPSFVDHDTGHGHPERPDRMRAIDKVLGHELFNDLDRKDAPLRDDVEKQILRVHPKSHLEMVRKTGQAITGNTHARIDGDTVMSKGSWEAALRAVSGGLEAVDHVMDKKNANAFCQVRPPGHHAEKDRAMGFCLFSNAAVAAYYARETYGAQRLAVVDFDVHHGNGTQDIFWSDKDMFYGSTHQMPLFPGTGALSETGVGNIWNAPLSAGDDGSVFRDAYTSRILEPLKNFSPDLVIISAGFDAHKHDPLGGLRLVEADFMWATAKLIEIADKTANGRVVSMLEGGYDLEALAKSVGVHVRTLMEAAS